MTFTAGSFVPINNAGKPATQLGRHWPHNLSVAEEDKAFRISFPKDACGADRPGDTLVTVQPTNGGVRCHIEPTAKEQRDRLKTALERHVDRFALREAPLAYEWRDS